MYMKWRWGRLNKLGDLVLGGYYDYMAYMIPIILVIVQANICVSLWTERIFHNSHILDCLPNLYVIYIWFLPLSRFCEEWKVYVTPDFVTRAFDAQISNILIGDLITISVAIPCLVTIGLCLTQMLGSFLFSPVVSFACLCGVYVTSAYYTEWFFLGNYTMWIRTKWLTTDGVHLISGVILALVLILLVWNIGEYYFSRKDLF